MAPKTEQKIYAGIGLDCEYNSSNAVQSCSVYGCLPDMCGDKFVLSRYSGISFSAKRYCVFH